MSPLVVGLAYLLPLSTLLALLVTGLVRHYALRSGILDHPNARSSHRVPTPRGGGLAIVLVVLGGTAALAALGQASSELAKAILVGGALVAGVGWLDDRRSLSPGIRALVQTVAAVWALASLGGLPQLAVGGWVIQLGPWGSVLGVVGTVWMINLYNFMDGIDGLAGLEAVMVAFLGGLFALAHSDTGLALVAWLVGGAALGFLLWNWPPAKVFMGDVGSSFLGYAFAVLAIAGEMAGSVPILVWWILLAVFLVDATLTLARRVLSGERWYEAHRSHVYQLATQVGHSHKRVTVTVLVINLLLSAVATVLWRWPAKGLWVVIPTVVLLAAGHTKLYHLYMHKSFVPTSVGVEAGPLDEERRRPRRGANR